MTKLVEWLGQPIVIESRPGAGTNIAIEHVVKSAPDGYTLLMSSPPIAINMSLYKKPPFDTTRDLAAIAVFSQTPKRSPSLPGSNIYRAMPRQRLNCLLGRPIDNADRGKR